MFHNLVIWIAQFSEGLSTHGTQTNRKNDKMQNKNVISFYDNYPKKKVVGIQAEKVSV